MYGLICLVAGLDKALPTELIFQKVINIINVRT